MGADASHAWCSVYFPGWGWLDLDPTNDQVAPSRHVTVAWGRDYRDVTPLRGVVVGPAARQELTVAVDVARVDDPAPRRAPPDRRSLDRYVVAQTAARLASAVVRRGSRRMCWSSPLVT